MAISKDGILNDVKIVCHVDSGTGMTQDILVFVFRLETSFNFQYPEGEDEDGNLYARNATAYVLPKDIRDRLKKFDKKVVRSFQLRCPSFIEDDAFGEKFIEGTLSKQEADGWMDELKVFEAEYFQIRDEIVDQYDDLVARFVSEFLNTYIPPHHRRETRANFKKTIPSKEIYGSSFRIKLRYRDPKETGVLQ